MKKITKLSIALMGFGIAGGAFLLNDTSVNAQNVLPTSIAAPTVRTENSYANELPEVTVNYIKDASFLAFIQDVKENGAENYGVDDIEAYAQVDWSIGDNDWKYDEKWNTLERKVTESYWEKVDCGVSDSEVTDEVDLFNFDELDDSDWCEEGVGYCNIVKSNQFYTYDDEDGDKCVDIDWNTLGLNVRVRYVVRVEKNENYSYIYSDWSQTAKYGDFASQYPVDNLLKNGDFEYGVKDWVDANGVWDKVREESGYYPQHGRFFAWPCNKKNGDLKNTRIYQDISLAGYEAGNTVVLNAMVCNYNQEPTDQARIQLTFYDKDGKTLDTSTQDQRNPEWNSQSIMASIPKNAIKVRVSLWAYLHNGYDIDAYYDYASLVVTKDKISNVIISRKSGVAIGTKIAEGNKVTLSANNGTTSSPDAYDWSSSRNFDATVDANGVVTFVTAATDGVAIYAKDKNSGVIGVYWFNSDMKNITDVKTSATISKTTMTCTGSALKPSVVVKADGVALKNGTDYAVTYSKNTAIGTATVKITFAGNYSLLNPITKTFKIIPANVTSFKASSQTTTSVSLSWKKVSGAKGYVVYSYNTKTKKYTKLVVTSSTKATIKKLKAGTKYTYYIRAYGVSGSSYIYSSSYAKHQTATKTSTPSISVKAGSKKVTVSWKKVSGASGYEVYYATSKGGKYTKLTTTSKLTYTKTKLKKGKTYYFKIRTYEKVGSTKIFSSYSSVKSAKVK